MADQDNLATVVEQRNKIALAQKLVPLKAKLGLGFIQVYTSENQELLNLGATEKSLEIH